MDEVAAKLMGRALRGWQSHPDPQKALAGLTADDAGTRPPGASRSIYELLWHVVFWQDHCLAWIAGESPDDPGDENAWPASAAPARPEDWEGTAARFAAGLAEVEEFLASGDLDAKISALPGPTNIEIVQTIASHLSYHLGQIVFLRRMLGLWPPAQEPAGE